MSRSDTPFTSPTLCCKVCYKTHDHIYCDPWLEAIRLFFLRLKRAA